MVEACTGENSGGDGGIHSGGPAAVLRAGEGGRRRVATSLKTHALIYFHALQVQEGTGTYTLGFWAN